MKTRFGTVTTPPTVEPPSPNGNHSADPDEDTPDDPAQPGGDYILDGPTEIEARWGTNNNVLWAQGESLFICGPTGVGKTTLATQIVAALCGIQPTVLDLPVTPSRRVLYLAMDRPRQVRRALRRIFQEHHRHTLNQRLVIRPGPIPDLGRQPEALLALARLHDCDTIIIDSVKDAVTRLVDDEAANNFNRAIQHCNANGVDVLALHHQRKTGADGNKPDKLADVYGSTWLTAGSGSVILLWGEAGSEQIELTHVKQPAEELGPWNLEHDHHAGTTRIVRGFDIVAYLHSRGTRGATIAEVAQAHHGDIIKSDSAKWKKTERRLRELVRLGLAVQLEERARDANGQLKAGRYRAVTDLTTMDTTSRTTPNEM